MLTHNDKVDAFRRAKPDVYDKFKNHTLPKKQQQRKCRFGANCRKNKLGTCTFKHDPSDSAMPAEALKSTDDIIDNFGGISMMANTVDSENLIPIDITAPDYFVTPGGVTTSEQPKPVIDDVCAYSNERTDLSRTNERANERTDISNERTNATTFF